MWNEILTNIFDMKNLLLISSPFYKKGKFLEHCLWAIEKFLGEPEEGRNKILFIPYANVDGNYDDDTERVAEAFDKFGYEVVGVHMYTTGDCLADRSICCVYVGGGNTWLLRDMLDIGNLFTGIKHKVEIGDWKYIGESAGAIMACPEMLTTNSLAIVLPKRSNGFGFVSFQINPHFVVSSLISINMGETQEAKIKQFITYNPDSQVVGLPAQSWIETREGELMLKGCHEAFIFRKDGNDSIWRPNEVYDEVGML